MYPKLKVLFSLILLIFVRVSWSQNAEEFFNLSSQEYIQGNKEIAMQTVNKGLNQFPNNPKLTALKEKLEEEQENQDKNQDQENKENQDKKQDEKQQENQQQNDQQNQENEPKDERGKRKPNEPKPEPKDGEGEPRKEQISREDAERLLKSLDKDEQEIQRKLNQQKIKEKPIKTEKNW